MTKNQPNSRFRHLYVVVRLDHDMPLEDGFSLVSAWNTDLVAQTEADRLMALSPPGERDYQVVITRMKSPEARDVSQPTPQPNNDQPSM